MRKLCLFALRTVIFAAFVAALPGASTPRSIAPRCVAFGYFDSKDRLVSAPLVGPLVDGRRISDGYRLRLHPILKRMLMHFGIDIAAAGGTPIYSVADGVVVVAGRYGPSGLYVRIRHNAVYETAFAHLSAFGDGIWPGAHVRKGQVVGFVGSTGLSTGPHVHYAIFVRGSPVRPACRCDAVSVAVKVSRPRKALLPIRKGRPKHSLRTQRLKGTIEHVQTNHPHGN